MRGGRPRTAIGTYGSIWVHPRGGRFVAEARVRDGDGRLRRVAATAGSRTGAQALLRQRIAARPAMAGAGLLDPTSSFGELVAAWQDDLALRELSERTRANYDFDLRLHVLPAFEHFVLCEITTGRIERFLKTERRISYSRAKHSKTLLNLLFNFALRQDAVARNPVVGTTPLARPGGAPTALSVEQIPAIRAAAAAWRTGPDVKGPKPDGQVRDLLEVLLGTALRIGEALALRVCDVQDRPTGMVVSVSGTVVLRTGHGAVRQDHPKTASSVRRIPVPEFAAAVLRARIRALGDVPVTQTIFGTKKGGPLSPYNVRRTFREFLAAAHLSEEGITLHWFRRTGATVIARGAGKDAAAGFLGHSSTAVTEDAYIEPDQRIDRTSADLLERTLRPVGADGTLLRRAADEEETDFLDDLDQASDGDGEQPPALAA